MVYKICRIIKSLKNKEHIKENLAPLGLDFIKLGLNDVLYDPFFADMELRCLEEIGILLRYNENHDPETGRFTSGDGVDNSGESGIIKAGAFSGAKKTFGWKERHGERMYEEIRHRSTDVKKIAEYTPFKENAVMEIKQHMFFKEHRFSDGSIRRFDSDFDQAQAWDRLTKGKGTTTDIEMLKHEYVELTQMRIHGYDYETANAIANSKHNWWAMVEKEE